VTLGLRPDELRLAANGESPAIRGKVLVAERLGGQTHLHVEHKDHTIVAVVPSDRAVAPDEDVALAVDPAGAHFFGKDGRSLLA
jgi:ABC-type sugar transport system ATPase subunit